MKKLVSMVIALILVLAATSAMADVVKLNLSEVHIDGYPTTLADQFFADLVKERTEGRIEITVYNGGTLYGSEPEAIEAMVFGELGFARVSASPVAEFAPTINAVQLPYLYKSADHMWAVLNGEVGQSILDSIQTSGSGLIGLCYYDSGSRCFYLTKEAHTPADLVGLKIRMQDNKMMCRMVELLGGTPITGIGPNDIYSNIMSGVLDGAENNWPTYYTKGDYKAAPYYVLDYHTRVPEVLLASELALANAGVSAEDIEIIKACAKETQEFEIAEWKKMEVTAEEAVRADGTIVVELSADEYQQFRDAVMPIYEDAEFGAAYKDIIAQIDEVGKDF